MVFIYNLLICIMMRKLLLQSLRHFSKLTPETTARLRTAFAQNPTASTFAPFLTPDNTHQLFTIIIEAKISPKQSNAALSSLLEQCSTESDEQLNILANILKQRGFNHMRIGDLQAAISDFEQAIQSVLLMSQPSQLALAQFYKFTADLYLQLNDLKKAEKGLLEAENMLLEVGANNDYEVQSVASGFACIYTQMCMIKFRERRTMEAVGLLAKAEAEWQKVGTKILKEYELTCRLKCMLHILFNQTAKALEAAQNFLTFLKASPEYASGVNRQVHDLTSLYYLNIICTFKEGAQQEKQEVMELLRFIKSERGQQRLAETMALMGIKSNQYPI